MAMLLLVEEGTRGGVCHSIYRYAKANNKYMKDYDKKIKNRNIEMKIISMVRQCYKSFP